MNPGRGRLRRSDCSRPGIERRGRGRGFEYRYASGELVTDAADRERIAELAIPPAWRSVWICADPLGHLQATGIDAAGRKQYLYHPRWRANRDRRKFDEMLIFAAALPRLRTAVSRDLDRSGYGRERVLACAVRLLDRGLFRIGGEVYAEENGTYGLVTLTRRHVELAPGELRFDYPAKGGTRRVQAIADPRLRRLVGGLVRREDRSRRLLAYREASGWRAIRADDVNDYLRDHAGCACSAKDFRTWNATLLAAGWLARLDPPPPRSATAKRRAIVAATERVAEQLGNTPAVCRSSYIDPRVFDRFRGGATVSAVDLDRLLERDRARRRLERETLALLT